MGGGWKHDERVIKTRSSLCRGQGEGGRWVLEAGDDEKTTNESFLTRSWQWWVVGTMEGGWRLET